MPSHTALPVDSTAPAAQPGGWWAVCLCAGWCGTCRDYRALFDALAQAHPEVRFEWVDIEDESELAGDLDVETFPTLLIADGRKAHFLGPLLPQAARAGAAADHPAQRCPFWCRHRPHGARGV